jgi:hypothetical protein
MQHNFQDHVLLAQIITILVARVLVGFSKNWSALSNWGDNRWYCTWAFFISLYFPEFSGVLFPAASLKFEI